MAWLKIEINTPEKPEVWAIATALSIDSDLVVAKLFKVWRWFDTHTTNGHAKSVTKALLDSVTGVTGFATAMENVGWLIVSPSGIEAPNFNRHMGESAKKRAKDTERQAIYRQRKKNAQPDEPQASHEERDICHASSVTESVTREDKIRDIYKKEKINKKKKEIPPEWFEEFYQRYPNRVERKTAEGEFDKRVTADEQFAVVMAALNAQIAERDEKQRLGLFVPEWPAPHRWLKGERWNDQVQSNAELQKLAAAQAPKPAAPQVQQGGVYRPFPPAAPEPNQAHTAWVTLRGQVLKRGKDHRWTQPELSKACDDERTGKIMCHFAYADKVGINGRSVYEWTEDAAVKKKFMEIYEQLQREDHGKIAAELLKKIKSGEFSHG